MKADDAVVSRQRARRQRDVAWRCVVAQVADPRLVVAHPIRHEFLDVRDLRHFQIVGPAGVYADHHEILRVGVQRGPRARDGRRGRGGRIGRLRLAGLPLRHRAIHFIERMPPSRLASK